MIIGGVCEELALNRLSLSTFVIGDSVEDGVRLCRLILKLERHGPW